MQSHSLVLGAFLIVHCVCYATDTALSKEWSVPQVAESEQVKQIYEILKQPVSEKFTTKDRRGPLIDVLRRLAAAHELSLVIDEGLLRREPRQFEAKVEVPVADTSLNNVIRFLIEPRDWVAIPRLDGLYLTDSAGEYDMDHVTQSRVYQVEDLVTTEQQNSTADVSQTAIEGMSVPFYQPFHLDQLEQLITGTIAQHHWQEVGGKGVIRRFELPNTRPQLLIQNSRRIHSQVSDLLTLLKQAKLAQLAAKEGRDTEPKQATQVATSLGGTVAHPIRKTLADVREFPAFENVSLDEALNHVGVLCGIPWSTVHVKPRFDIIEAPSTGPKVSSPAGKFSGNALLKHWLTPHRFTWGIKYDLLLIANDEQADKTEAFYELRVYPVRDLVTFNLPQGGQLQDFDVLIQSVTATVAASTWSDAGGNGVIYTHDVSGSLVIIQSAEAHEQIAALLETARQSVPSAAKSVRSKENKPPVPEGLQLRVFTMDSNQSAKELAETIPQITTAERWATNGGKGTLHVVGSAVIVRQEHDVMKEVIKLMHEITGYVEPTCSQRNLNGRWGLNVGGHGIGGGGSSAGGGFF